MTSGPWLIAAIKAQGIDPQDVKSAAVATDYYQSGPPGPLEAIAHTITLTMKNGARVTWEEPAE